MLRSLPWLLLLFCSFRATPVFACSCATPKPPLTALKNVDAVFLGRVLAVTPSGEHRKKVTFAVRTIWKGKVSAVTAFTTGGDGASCGINFGVGQVWLVYAYSGDGEFSTNMCTRTIRLERAQADLQALGVGKEPSKKSSRSSAKSKSP